VTPDERQQIRALVALSSHSFERAGLLSRMFGDDVVVPLQRARALKRICRGNGA